MSGEDIRSRMWIKVGYLLFYLGSETHCLVEALGGGERAFMKVMGCVSQPLNEIEYQRHKTRVQAWQGKSCWRLLCSGLVWSGLVWVR